VKKKQGVVWRSQKQVVTFFGRGRDQFGPKKLVVTFWSGATKHKDIVNYIKANNAWDGVWKFCRILDHTCVKRSDKNYMQCGVNILIEWESAKTLWQLLHRKDKAGIYDSDPVTVSIYARKKPP